MAFQYIAVLDFEATCADRSDPDWNVGLQEIIEFPVGLVSVEQGALLETFHRMVRPTAQPQLTDFCTELTSIEQHELDGQKTISEVMLDFQEWIQRHQLTPDNTLVATCGDWDLRRMWAQQAGLVEGLPTPSIFKQWCNLKVPFKKRTGTKAKGMMGMLASAGIEHQGRHHRGYDDVQNLAALTIWLLQGGSLEPTWAKRERRAEWSRLESKRKRVRRRVKEQQQMLENLPATVPPEVGQQHQLKAQQLSAEMERLTRLAAVFS